MNPVKIKSYHPINPNYDGFNDDDDGDGDSDNSNNHNNKQDSPTSKYTKRIRKNRFSPFFSSKYHHLTYRICYEQMSCCSCIWERRQGKHLCVMSKVIKRNIKKTIHTDRYTYRH